MPIYLQFKYPSVTLSSQLLNIFTAKEVSFTAFYVYQNFLSQFFTGRLLGINYVK